MGFRFRKSIKIAKGVRLNLNKKSVGLSFGTKGARYTINSNGRKTASVGIPGTGMYWTESTQTKKKSNSKKNKSNVKKTNFSFIKFLLYFVFLPFIAIYYMFLGFKYVILNWENIMLKLNITDIKTQNIIKWSFIIILVIGTINIGAESLNEENKKINNAGIIENTTTNSVNDISENVMKNSVVNENYIYTTEYPQYIYDKTVECINNYEIFQKDKVEYYSLNSDAMLITIYTNKFYDYKTIETKTNELAKDLISCYSEKEYKKTGILSPSVANILIQIRGNSKDIYTKQIENTYMVLSYIDIDSEIIKDPQEDISQYITISDKIYFGE